MKLRDLKKVENKLLCILEDILLDSLVENMPDMASIDGEEDKKKSATNIALNVTQAIKDNAREIALICYINDDGSAITKEDIEGLPIKMKVFKECYRPILVMVAEFMKGSGEEEEGKSQRVTTKKSS